MPQPSGKPDREIELLFPVKGINVSTEYERQPKATTPTGNNVLAFEPSGRGRGGSRAGLSKFIADTVPSGANLIQHMNIVVDPQQPSLLANSEINGDTQADPDTARYPTRLVRVGGDAIQTSKASQRQSPSNPLIGTHSATVTFVTPQDGFADYEVVSAAGGGTTVQGNAFPGSPPGSPTPPNVYLIMDSATYNAFIGLVPNDVISLTLTQSSTNVYNATFTGP